MANYTSEQMLNELSTTELVVLKDALDVEVERLRSIIPTLTMPELPKARAIFQHARAKQDISLKLSLIIEARFDEQRA